jgi:hypothetical protein
VHHGAVSFENLKEGGCAFHVDLPLAMPSEASGKNASGSTTGAS